MKDKRISDQYGSVAFSMSEMRGDAEPVSGRRSCDALNISRFLLLLISLIAFPALAQSVNQHAIDFSGSWELDYQLSDHTNEKVRWLYVQAKAEAEREMDRAALRRGYRVDPNMFNFQSVIGLGRLTEKIAQATVLTITQEHDHIVVNRNDDFALVCDFSDMGIKRSPFGAEGCEWQQDQLTFRIALPDGLNVYHRLSLATDRSRLNVATTVSLSGVRYPFTLNRVYMPFEPGEGLYNCEYTIANQTTCTLSGNSTTESESSGIDSRGETEE